MTGNNIPDDFYSRGITYRNLDRSEIQQVWNLLQESNGELLETKADHENWRISAFGAIFISYDSDTLYVAPPGGEDQRLEALIEEIIRSLNESEMAYHVGLDESGRGEIFGPLVLAGVLVEQNRLPEIRSSLGSVWTIQSQSPKYWEKIRNSIQKFAEAGALQSGVELIPPAAIDRYQMGYLLDNVYVALLQRLLADVENPDEYQITVDDYGIGEPLTDITERLLEKGYSVCVEPRADENYFESQLAAALARSERESWLERIRSSQSSATALGSGNLQDDKTQQWLKEMKSNNLGWPWFVRTSFQTVAGKSEPESNDPQRSHKSITEYMSGPISTWYEDPEINCPHCDYSSSRLQYQRNSTLAKQFECDYCDEPLQEIGLALRHCYGSVVADEAILELQLLSTDLKGCRLFEGQEIIVPPGVRSEATEQIRTELIDLIQRHEAGQIQLRNVDSEHHLSDLLDESLGPTICLILDDACNLPVNPKSALRIICSKG
jgi:ribonuclease HII